MSDKRETDGGMRDYFDAANARLVAELDGTPAAPDRPGDRDQQQAAELIDEITFGGHSWDGARQTVANAVAAARAEEAARWQAKIEARLAQHQPTPAEDHFAEHRFPRDMCTCGESFYGECEARLLLASLLDGEQR